MCFYAITRKIRPPHEDLLNGYGQEAFGRGLTSSIFRPGLPWQIALEEQISSIHSAAVLIGKSGIGPWQNQELRAFLSEFLVRTCPVIPVILSDCLTPSPHIPVFLREMTSVDFRCRQSQPMKRLIWGITGRAG